ncbi:hypothetical protein [Rubritalea tangerina]
MIVVIEEASQCRLGCGGKGEVIALGLFEVRGSPIVGGWQPRFHGFIER